MQGNAILDVSNLKCGYPGKPLVLNDFSVAMERGGFMAVVGPNGVGKTTLLRVLSGFAVPDAGAVRLDGRDLASMNIRDRARLMAVVPQNVFSPLPYTVRQVVSMGRHPRLPRWSPMRKADRDAVAAAMARADIENIAGKDFQNLSGGERQRVMVAAALAQEPELLLLDEPTSQLDIGHATSLMRTLVALNAESGLSILMISHDIQLAARFAKRLVFIKDGKVAADGAPKDTVSASLLKNVFDCDAEIIFEPVDGNPLIHPL